MGTDKAFLALDGVPLVARQTALLRAVGLDDILISGRAGIDYTAIAPDARVVLDPVSDAGPLAGLAALLDVARHPWVLVIAVDLPFLTPDYLRKLLATGGGRVGVVAEGPRGFEPLVALYPRALLTPIHAALTEKNFQLQALLRNAVDAGLMASIHITDVERPLFANWNTPADVSASRPT